MADDMHRLTTLLISLALIGCASSIVDGEATRTSNIVLNSKSDDAVVEMYFSGNVPQNAFTQIGIVNSRARVLDKGINELKTQARHLGADAVTNIKYERRFSADHLQDLYFIDGNAVIWKVQ